MLWIEDAAHSEVLNAPSGGWVEIKLTRKRDVWKSLEHVRANRKEVRNSALHVELDSKVRGPIRVVDVHLGSSESIENREDSIFVVLIWRSNTRGLPSRHTRQARIVLETVLAILGLGHKNFLLTNGVRSDIL